MHAVPIRLALDRDLPVPLVVQLTGLIRYGIAGGDFRAGDRLPSVRGLADEVGVAPMTITAVYRDLKAAGLIEARAGSGTFVANRAAPLDRRLRDFHDRADALIDEGLALGLGGTDIAGLVAARISARQALGSPRRIMLVGLFAVATADYARALAAALGPTVQAEATTLDALQFVATTRARAEAADLVLTFAHLEREVAALLPGRRVTAIAFTPSDATRDALKALDPGVHLLAVSRFPEFLPLMRSGLARFAPQVAVIDVALLDAEGMASRIAGHDVVIYATGAEAMLDRLSAGTLAIEYRHSPDPGDIDRIVRPLLSGREPATHTRSGTAPTPAISTGSPVRCSRDASRARTLDKEAS